MTCTIRQEHSDFANGETRKRRSVTLSAQRRGYRRRPGYFLDRDLDNWRRSDFSGQPVTCQLA